MSILIIANWVVICLVGSAMVYALAWAVYDTVATGRRFKAYEAELASYHQLLLDDVYYRDSYGNLFSDQLNSIMRVYGRDLLVNNSGHADYIIKEEVRDLLNLVDQFVSDSKVMS
tara:strand:- start:79 stop:423 length:345 start_codon:yes stop_codon:yes gene_type:complete